MRPFYFTIRSLVYFWKRNLFLALGIAISTAVLTGALIVGDSVKHSLHTISEQRLGQVQSVLLSGDRYFTGELAEKLQKELDLPVSGILMLDGMAVADGGRKRISDVQILGTGQSFDAMAGLQNFYSEMRGDSVIISSNLAEGLGLQSGDEFILRMNAASLVPLNAPFVSDADNSVTIRATVASIAGADELGTFNIRNAQTAPFNIFISAETLQDLMDIGNRCNLMLFAGKEVGSGELTALIRQIWNPEDAGLTMKYYDDLQVTQVMSDRVFIDEPVTNALTAAHESAKPFLTYFVNTITMGGNATPYSFVSGIQDEELGRDKIIINQWLANDLDAGVGDTLGITFFAMGPLRELSVDSASFVIKQVIPMDDPLVDHRLMPHIPGLSDAGNCRDWETGVPVNLESIRDKDEDYWNQYSGSPKAFISLSAAEYLWENRFGKYTSFRFTTVEPDQLGRSVMQFIDPVSLGFEVRHVRSSAVYAAENGVDFSMLFGGLSFFLLAGAIMLTVLLFLLNLDGRKGQIRTLSAMGIPFRMIRQMIAREGLAVAVAGTTVGLLLAVVYNRLIFMALNSIWMDIVRTTTLEVSIQPRTMVMGFMASMAIAFMVIWFPLGRYIKKMERRHIRKPGKDVIVGSNPAMLLTMTVLTVTAAIGLVILQFVRDETVNSTVFFVAGALLLVSALLFSYVALSWLHGRSSAFLTLSALSLKNAVSNRSRSMGIIVLFAMGTFIVISTGSNKKDLFVNAEERSGGTGGFLYYAESVVPVLKNLNDPEVRYDYGLSKDFDIVQLRLADGDDASCLNLNRIENPGIMGVDPAKLHGRFSFVTATDGLNREEPWSSLSVKMEEGLIPAIADETVIKWGLGKKVGDTLRYTDALGNEMNLLLIGGLAPSVFQGSVLISEEHFLKHFPSSSGTKVFLVDGNMADTAIIEDELAMGLRDLGWTMELSAARLARFNSVTNTYLSIFMVLGALGLLLGTVGLSIVLSRSILERKHELGLMRAVGIGMGSIKKLLIREYLALLVTGTLAGTIASVIATLPSYMSEHTEVSFSLTLVIIVTLILNGLLWIWWVTGIFLKRGNLNSILRNE
ncbi:MAG: FtsX-like permease family protein [Bacteroidales bacterium]